jgi:AcrR family transcriptional regulator
MNKQQHDNSPTSAQVIHLKSANLSNKLYCRRAVLKSLVRKSFAKHGFSGLHVRELAATCGVSVQTLYNHFGSREDIVASANSELITAQLKHLDYKHSVTGQNFVLLGCEQIIELLERDNDYTRSLFLTIQSLPKDNIIVERMHSLLANTFSKHLTILKKDHQLRQCIDTEKLALTILNAIDGVMMTTSCEVAVKEQLRLTVGLLMLGACQGAEAEIIENYLIASQNGDAHLNH